MFDQVVTYQIDTIRRHFVVQLTEKLPFKLKIFEFPFVLTALSSVPRYVTLFLAFIIYSDDTGER